MNMRSAVYYNKHQKEGPTFKRGEKAFLLRRNIKTKRPSQKLDHQKIRPFIIKKQIRPINYQLRLPELMKHLHPVFHILLLEPAPQNTQTVENIKIKKDNKYKVKKFIN